MNCEVDKSKPCLDFGTLSAYLEWTFGFHQMGGFIFRGQTDESWDLLPSIARNDTKVNPRHVEQEIISELKLRLPSVYSEKVENDWQLLALIQHYGAPTRFLDWTRSALTALWFAISEASKRKEPDAPEGQKELPDSAVYALKTEIHDFVSDEHVASEQPLEIDRMRIYQPVYFDRRLAAQQGLFSVHRYWEGGGDAVSLERTLEFPNRVRKLVIPSRFRFSLLKELDAIGVNAASLFPDLAGLCQHLSMKHGLSSRYVYLAGLGRVQTSATLQNSK